MTLIGNLVRFRTSLEITVALLGVMTKAAYEEELPYAKFSKMYHGNVKKLELAMPYNQQKFATMTLKEVVERDELSPTSGMNLVLRDMQTEKIFKYLKGVAPPGDLERKHRTRLDEST